MTAAIKQRKYWLADPTELAEGKVHTIDPDDETRTICGKSLTYIKGKPADSHTGSNCKLCLSVEGNREHRARLREQWRELAEVQRADKIAQDKAWWRKYDAYLLTDKWARRRKRVLERANYRCEACLNADATEVHHTTYAHTFHEPAFDLRAVCRPCHEALTRLDRKGGSV